MCIKLNCKTNRYMYQKIVDIRKIYSVVLKELRNNSWKLFLCPLKNRRKHKQHFKLLFSKINLHLVVSNQAFADRKRNPFMTEAVIFFIPCDKWKTLFFIIFESAWCCFLWTNSFERSPCFMRYLYNNCSMLILKVQMETAVYYAS